MLYAARKGEHPNLVQRSCAHDWICAAWTFEALPVPSFCPLLLGYSLTERPCAECSFWGHAKSAHDITAYNAACTLPDPPPRWAHRNHDRPLFCWSDVFLFTRLPRSVLEFLCKQYTYLLQTYVHSTHMEVAGGAPQVRQALGQDRKFGLWP